MIILSGCHKDEDPGGRTETESASKCEQVDRRPWRNPETNTSERQWDTLNDSDREQIISAAFARIIKVKVQPGRKFMLAIGEGARASDEPGPNFPETLLDPSDAVLKAVRLDMPSADIWPYSVTGLPANWESTDSLQEDESLMYISFMGRVSNDEVRVALGYMEHHNAGGCVYHIVKRNGRWKWTAGGDRWVE